ncbi:hypothetical protein PIB30_083567 [Stylosanthes scabra]|uniref:Uncharacterized protein n=1 Tax=Stylosanthes scabra TaxID=79078 RepID=A0ABU6YR51_9FABA|nr:hypothetical protein [Stylosanthes scabra]
MTSNKSRPSNMNDNLHLQAISEQDPTLISLNRWLLLIIILVTMTIFWPSLIDGVNEDYNRFTAFVMARFGTFIVPEVKYSLQVYDEMLNRN